MNIYDNELLLLAKMKLEVNNTQILSVETLTEYKNYIIQNFKPTEDLIQYIVNQPLNIILILENEINVIEGLKNIKIVFPYLIIDEFLNFYKMLKQSNNEPMNDVLAKYQFTDNSFMNNVIFKAYIFRFELLSALSINNIEKISLFSAKLKQITEKVEEISSRIKWSIEDVQI